MRIVLTLAAAAAVLSGAAGAQNSLASKPGLLESVGATEVAQMLAEFGFKSELRSASGAASPSLVVTTDGGAKFLIGFFDCADAKKPSGCKQVMVSTAQASGGVDFNDLNAFNGQSSVTTVVYEPSNQILIFGRNIFAPGGMGRDNFKLQVALFLNDMQGFVESRRAGVDAEDAGRQVEDQLRHGRRCRARSAPADDLCGRLGRGRSRDQQFFRRGFQESRVTSARSRATL
jgi:hypothetical protein